MRIRQTLLSVFAVLACVLPNAARAADIAFFPVETSNLAPADAIAIGELLAQSYAAVSHQAVLAPTHTAPALSQGYDAAAASLGVPEYVRVTALAAGRVIVVNATRFQGPTPIYQSKMTVNAIEEVPALADRMAYALFYRTPEPQTVNQPPRAEQRAAVDAARAARAEERDRQRLVGFKTGLYFPFAKKAQFQPLMGIQFDMRLDVNERVFLEFGAGALVPTSLDDDYDCGSTYDAPTTECRRDNDGNLGGFTTEVGASFLLTEGNAAPYIGVGVLPRILLDSNDDIANMSAYAQFGLMLPRNATTRFYLDARAAQAMIPMHLDNGRAVFPTELTLHVGVGW